MSYAQIQSNKKEISEPLYLQIPSIKVDAAIEELSIKDGQMQDPTGIEKAGWYKESVKPGEVGNAVIAGHLDDTDGNPAIFWKLQQLQYGDQLTVEDKEGNAHQFTIREVKEYPSTRLPLATFFTKSLERNLILITCSGVFDTALDSYTRRLVVFASLQGL